MPSTHELREHEDYRWSYLSREQLDRRLRRITVPEKLECFLDKAYETGDVYLLQRGIERAGELGLRGMARTFGMRNQSLRNRPVYTHENPFTAELLVGAEVEESRVNECHDSMVIRGRPKEEEKKAGKRVIRIGRRRRNG